MKVILLTDVPKVGNKYDVKEFKDGFAQNVLITRGLAILATTKALSNLKNKMEAMNKKRVESIEILSDLVKKLSNKKISIKVKSNEKGHLFKSVTSSDVAEAIEKILSFEIDEKTLVMENIKEIGDHLITIKKGDFEGKFKIEIIAI